MNVNDIPGYREAVIKEQLNRDAAFVMDDFEVGGFRFRPFTLREYTILRAVRSPFVCGGSDPTVQDVAKFLQIVALGANPIAKLRSMCVPEGALLRFKFGRPLWRRRTAKKLARWEELMKDINEYLDAAFMDAPPSVKGAQPVSYFSDAAFWCAMMGTEYGFSWKDTMDMPLAVLFQFNNERRQRNRQFCGNPSDRVAVEEVAKLPVTHHEQLK